MCKPFAELLSFLKWQDIVSFLSINDFEYLISLLTLEDQVIINNLSQNERFYFAIHEWKVINSYLGQEL
jgi:hypothetical protein